MFRPGLRMMRRRMIGAHGGGRSRSGWNGRRHQFGDQSPLPAARCSAAGRLRSAGADAADAAATGDAAAADQPDAAARRNIRAATAVAPLPPAPTPAAGNKTASQLQQVAQLHASGVLTDQEFAEAKQKILAGG